MEAVRPELTKTIEITEFVALDEIDPILFDKPYYLEPEKRGFKAYSLLREALRSTGMAGISRVVIRTREYLSAMFVRGDVLMVMLWGSRMPHPEKPDQLIWDLDPDSAVPWPEVLGAAFLIRDFLAKHGLDMLVKTSGGKGLHFVLFIKRTHNWDSMREFTKAVAREVAVFNPSRLVITSSKDKRKGRIFIDWMRNGEDSTCIAPWSLRARDGASVSMPVNWCDLAKTTATGFTIQEPLTPPPEWIEPEPQLIPKALLRHLTG